MQVGVHYASAFFNAFCNAFCIQIYKCVLVCLKLCIFACPADVYMRIPLPSCVHVNDPVFQVRVYGSLNTYLWYFSQGEGGYGGLPQKVGGQSHSFYVQCILRHDGVAIFIDIIFIINFYTFRDT